MVKPCAERSRGQEAILKFIYSSTAVMSFPLALPLLHIYLSVLICVDGNKVHGDLVCYKGTYFIHFFAALLGIIGLLAMTITSIISNSERNPFSNTPHASTQNRPLLYRLYMKFILALFIILTAQVILLIY